MVNKTAESFEFKTEVSQLLDLVIHSLYSHKDIFLRELLSNASDAIEKLRFESLKNKDLLGTETAFKIKLIRNDQNKTLTISDNGIGMTKEELIANLGTIAKSGTKEFIEKIKQAKGNTELIGQFGVGFYSSFMVADKVTVISKTSSGTAQQWESQGEGGFAIADSDKTTRGTEVILHLKKECQDYLEEYRLRELVRKYSDYLEFPIVMDIEREEKPKDKDGKEIESAKAEKKITEETLNNQKAIWTKAKNEVTAEEYKDFYKYVSHDFEDPLETIHYSAEGTNEFKALLYIPGKAPYDLFTKESHRGINLYIKRVFIMHDCKKLIPEYLRFLRGVVDSSDLPLNVSREILQEDMQLNKIQKNIVKKILSTLRNLKDKETEKYLKFYKEFGAVVKEGLHYDYDNKEALTELLLFETTKTEPNKYRSLDEYVKMMPKEQKEIYYITAENKATAMSSPHLEVFKSKNFEVILFTDPVDEWIIPNMPEYKGKKLKAIDKGDIELGDKKETEEKLKQSNEQFGDVLTFVQETLKDSIKEAKFSLRLTDSPACLVADEFAMSAQMEKMFKAMGQEMPQSKRTLELNPNHPLINTIKKIITAGSDKAEAQDYVKLIHAQALLAEGSPIPDPNWFTKTMAKIMVKAAE